MKGNDKFPWCIRVVRSVLATSHTQSEVEKKVFAFGILLSRFQMSASDWKGTRGSGVRRTYFYAMRIKQSENVAFQNASFPFWHAGKSLEWLLGNVGAECR